MSAQSGRGESNPRLKLGKLAYYHCTTTANFVRFNYLMIFLRKNQLFLMVCLVLSGIMIWVGVVRAELIGIENQINVYSLRIDTPTISRGYTASVFNDNFRVGIFPEVLNEETEIVFKEFNNPAEILPLLDQKDGRLVSKIYEFDIKNQAAFHNERPIIVEIKYPENSNNLKKIYFWDKISGRWRELPSKSITERNVVRALLHLPYARLAIFENPNIMEIGVASWYAYKFCDCAASPDWPKGTRLRVTDLDDLDTIVVTVNDYGPNRSIHPDRVIDLDVVAFKKIAPKWLGLIKVKVEKL